MQNEIMIIKLFKNDAPNIKKLLKNKNLIFNPLMKNLIRKKKNNLYSSKITLKKILIVLMENNLNLLILDIK